MRKLFAEEKKEEGNNKEHNYAENHQGPYCHSHGLLIPFIELKP